MPRRQQPVDQRMKLTPFPQLSERGGPGGGGGEQSGIHFIHNSDSTATWSRTDYVYQRRDSRELQSALQEGKERLSLDWFSGLQEGRVLTKQTRERERERERDVMCRLTATFSLKVHQNGKARGLKRKAFFNCFFHLFDCLFLVCLD